MQKYNANTQLKLILWILAIVAIVAFVNSKWDIIKTVSVFNTSQVNQTETFQPTVRFKNPNGQILTINVEVADTEAKRQKGLQERTFLEENDGMLFIFSSETQGGFWMKDTLIPLDLIFVSKESKVNNIKKDFQPCKIVQCEIYVPNEKYLFVVEVNSGWADKNGIQVGDSVEINASDTL